MSPTSQVADSDGQLAEWMTESFTAKNSVIWLCFRRIDFTVGKLTSRRVDLFLRRRRGTLATGALKTQVLENASTEKASTKQRISQGWKTQVRKMQVQCKPSVR